MKLPRDLSSDDLIKKLSELGYEVSRQTGSHIRLTTSENGTHQITIPAHNPLKIGTLNNILRDVALHFNLSKDELLKILF
ncbi:type II toxin-antitoxin system HicA family toxin [Microcystis aeruginosa]|jgi:predicted RNA binding protein YcfA (HicA-like mRNA interferase family)|uniref:Type II toxin-antitoxin system HicA family toxin n=2 Tax=Microcystis TaxID=1125 RepID=A0A552I7K7_MICVR|nr:type II toxin-antitoxin system HicA family toxin [Microcystis aeruginosa]NCR07919.1 type II toxin-antitoxin system HicA family toxin [Microcystis aeruginosa LG13-11]TRU75066.1 MAG: type II toxin-antitoxin system HicA family toxin [Microcystis viridis Mv_BB_P_19951000_S68]TRU75721.1 MAG: type II toxin-antitoxin system HicA family toxin [Microcystis viridis Mv_BB_P_19951000_S69]TRU79454.1 MAG: type II toxin-antitoxin system HicA family toxin [Microcystis viridis Mv_BB_P_19951000_S68D]TRU81712